MTTTCNEETKYPRKLWFNTTDKVATFDITDSIVVESEEIAPGVIIHYGLDGNPTQVEINQICSMELCCSYEE